MVAAVSFAVGFTFTHQFGSIPDMGSMSLNVVENSELRFQLSNSYGASKHSGYPWDFVAEPHRTTTLEALGVQSEDSECVWTITSPVRVAHQYYHINFPSSCLPSGL